MQPRGFKPLVHIRAETRVLPLKGTGKGENVPASPPMSGGNIFIVLAQRQGTGGYGLAGYLAPLLRGCSFLPGEWIGKDCSISLPAIGKYTNCSIPGQGNRMFFQLRGIPSVFNGSSGTSRQRNQRTRQHTPFPPITSAPENLAPQGSMKLYHEFYPSPHWNSRGSPPRLPPLPFSQMERPAFSVRAGAETKKAA
jgi:hypothetical protein